MFLAAAAIPLPLVKNLMGPYLVGSFYVCNVQNMPSPYVSLATIMLVLSKAKVTLSAKKMMLAICNSNNYGLPLLFKSIL